MAGNVTPMKQKNTGGAKRGQSAKKSSGTSSENKGKSTGKRAGSRSKRTSAGQEKGKSTKKAEQTRTIEEMNEYHDNRAFEQGMILLVCSVLAVFAYVSFFGLAGRVGTVVGGGFFALFGWVAWLVPAGIMVSLVFFLANPKDKRVARRIGSGITVLVALMGLTDLWTKHDVLTDYYDKFHKAGDGVFQSISHAFAESLHHGKWSGGMIGRGIDRACSALLGNVGTACVLIALLLIGIYIFYGIEWMAMLRKRNAYYQEMGEAYEVIRDEEDYVEPSYQVIPPKTRRKLYSDRKMQTVNLEQMNAQIDKLEEKQAHKALTADDVTKKTGDLEEILPDVKNRRKPVAQLKKAEEASSDEEHPENTGDNDRPETFGTPAIPIYREELRQKFGGRAEETKATDANSSPVMTVQESFDDIAPIALQSAAEEEKKPLSQTITSSLRSEDSLFAPTEHIEELAEQFAEDVQEPEPPKKKKASVSVPESAKPKKQPPAKKETEHKPAKPYQYPPIDLLSLPKNISGRISDEQLRHTASLLQETLQSFNVNVSLGAVTCGPTVTRYEVLPEQGVRVNKITNLADDLKLSLAAASIRIEAPIPGKAAVGIEVPNPESSPVYFRELLEGDEFRKAKSPVTFAVGKDIAGKRIMTDIAKMPHLLIAGATGSGKSVCINTLIMSILYKADPSDVKLIMIDPKVVELSVYNGIPHLFCPVVTDPKEAASSLNWAVREMMERYNKFKELGVRNIAGYNQKISTLDPEQRTDYEKMPSLVIIVDEFADLMMVASKEVEDAVCRLAQLARAAGIHLVLATQRPSVNVITGVIKANIPSRIAFSVSSAIDSRTILDKGGAEKLLGKGDMLFFPSGESEPVRVQGAFVSDKEVSDVVDFLRETNEEPEYNHEVTEIQEEPEENTLEKAAAKSDEDEYFADAGRFVIESERAAAGQLQRRFSIGFNRAGRIIDQLHKAGVVGPAEGTKPRKVLMTLEQFESYLAGESVSGELSDDISGDVEQEMTAAEEFLADFADDEQ